MLSQQRRSTVVARDVRFEYPPAMSARWTPRVPEAAIAANAVSLLMPYVEPYVVKSVRRALPDLPTDLHHQAESYLHQELQHHVNHRQFNSLIASQYRGISVLERWIRATYRWLAARRSERFHLAFAAGSETVAFGAARWFENHRRELFDGAEHEAASLFFWHLAEEVEHKCVAHDVYVARGGKKPLYTLAMAISLIVLGWFTVLGTLVMLTHDRRLLNPLAWWRLVRWSITLAWEMLPTMAASVMPGHHPSQLVDPLSLTNWLTEFDQHPANCTEPRSGRPPANPVSRQIEAEPLVAPPSALLVAARSQPPTPPPAPSTKAAR